EINNPLTGVLGAAQILAMDLPPSSDGYALAQEIEAQAQRIRKIVTNLHRLAQKETGQELATVDLNRIIEDAVELVGFEELRKGNVVVDRQYHQPPPALRGAPVRLQEAVVELITNARRAMPEGGRLMLSTFVPDPRLVALRVADTGRGIAPEIIDKIFDPFFTTKHNWTSLGMGLTLVHKIVEDHRGTILVDSRVGQGASFTVTFPVPSGPSHLE
ncbi:MAG: HAMP domain-containing histidine kinase, partial [Deltaproteobacteria bacterium]|nr:HAMP domain-containing histidine kinase [Deltaproteobacteria bacterium]